MSEPETEDFWVRHAREEKEAKANGSRCSKCGKYIMFPLNPPGHPKQCFDCEQLHKSGIVDHTKFIRCPACGHTSSPYEDEEYSVLEDGSHDVTCHICEHEFEVTTTINFSFESPERLKEGDDEPEVEEPDDEPEDDD